MLLRKVLFRLGEKDGYNPDKTADQYDLEKKLSRMREGWFHCWIPTILHSAELDEKVHATVALIEDAETHKLHEVIIERMEFVEPPIIANKDE